MEEQLPAGGHELSPAEIAALDARWASCWTPREIADRLTGIDPPWYVVAGWALDLFRGEQTREHGDLEIGVPAARFPEVRDRFPGYAFDAPGNGRIWENATPDVLAALHQTWLRDPATGNYLVDVFREPHDGDTWLCRRDETIRLPYSDIILRTDDGMRSESVVDAREMAGWRDRPGPGAIVHSDRGGQGTQTWADVRGVGGRCDRSSVQLRACVLAPP